MPKKTTSKKSSSKKALVTGGAGFLGRHIINQLIENGYKVIAYDLSKPESLPPNVEFVKGDVLNLEKLKKATKGCDYFFHCAAIADIETTRQKPIETMQVNVVGTANCLEAAKSANIKRFMFSSSVYASSKRGSFYRISKQAGEELCKEYEKKGLNYTIMRYGSLYGRGTNDWNFVHKVCRDLLEKGEFIYYGSGEELREFINIEDAARESIRVAEKEEFSDKTVLITGHQRMRMKDFFELIAEIVTKDVKIQYKKNTHEHYKITPYTFDENLPVRINMSRYIDVGEGILACLEEVNKNS